MGVARMKNPESVVGGGGGMDIFVVGDFWVGGPAFPSLCTCWESAGDPRFTVCLE